MDLVTLQNAFRLTVPCSGTVSSSFGYKTFAITGSCFMSFSGTIEAISYKSLVDQFNRAMTGSTITASFNTTTERVELTGTVAFTADFNTNTSARLLGFTIGVSSSNAARFLSGSRVPWNYWREHKNSRSKWDKKYEPDPIVFDHISDDGHVYQISKSGSVFCADWTFWLIPQNRVRRENATLERPFTWEEMVTSARLFPIVVHSGSPSQYTFENKENVYKFRGQESDFHPEHPFEDYENQLNLPVKFYIVPT